MGNGQSNDILLERFEVIACAHCQQPIDTATVEPFSLIQCPACGSEMHVPARFANFILLEQLGKGGMGAVYKAYDETLGRTVALKVTQQAIAQDREFVTQFLQEARALAAINHPNIVQIYNYGEENGQPYIVMELVDGDRLDHIHEKHKQLDEIFVLQTALQVISGLQAAQAAGMTHGDIKPANILYDKAGNAKVADFGLARFSGQKPKPGEIWGTPYYVAPEVVRGQAPNAGSDIYSLGGTLYHVLTGEPPFNGETVTDTVLLRFKEPPPDPRQFKASVSAPTAAILLRTLEMDPFSRYPTFESLSRDIASALQPLLDARSGKKNTPEKKSPITAIVLSLIALAIIAGSSWLGVHIFKAKRADRAALAQRERDIAEGRLRKQFRDGKIIYVRVDSDGGGAAAASPEAAPVNEWKIPASTDIAVEGDDSVDSFKDRTVLLLRAGNKGTLDDASKIYLRFPLKNVDLKRLTQASLQLTAGKRGSVKIKTNPYKLNVWALRAPAPWDDTLRWSSAPANHLSDAGLLTDQAVLLTTFDIPANPEAGDRFLITAKPLADFIRAYDADELTLILTGDTTTDHKGGWRITATEDDRFQPPTLLLKAD